MAVLCRSEPLSWLDAAGIATEDRREINPGMMLDNVRLRREASAMNLNARGSAMGLNGRSSSVRGGLGSANTNGGGWDELVVLGRKKEEDEEV